MSLKIFGTEERQHSPSVFQVGPVCPTGKAIDFCYLSNKFFPTPEIMDELSRDFSDVVRNYPSMQGEQTELAARLTGYRPEQIIVGNGASELIHLVTARLGSRWLMPYPSYMEYENVVRDFGKAVHLFQLQEEEQFKVNAARLVREVEENRIDAMVLPNPNSPTGQKTSVQDLLQILDQASSLKTVVIDESFIEFTAERREDIPSLHAYLDKYPQLIIMRSLGKDFGVCGLRLGLMATANQEVLAEIRRFLPIWNVSPLAERFLRLCSGRMSDYERARVQCIRETQLLSEHLAKSGAVKVFETYSNFILLKLLKGGATSVELRDHLLSKMGFYVRDCSRKLGLGNKFIRIGTNLPAENARLVEAIAEFLAAH
ncbi:MAG TPA: histidinol-phosphate transaminase [Candidatus Saccharimonadales bacterium]|nr:histidinol-phosphate transaminase [Candidatus Saccharimonadales bacterium]